MSGAQENRQWTRKIGEAAFFVAVVGVLWTADTVTKLSEIAFHNIDVDPFRLIVAQVTSAVVVLLLVPAVAWWLSRFPLQRDRVFAAIIGHILGSALFATTHYFFMVGLRFVVFSIADRTYIFSDFWFRNLVIEYQKDIKIYLGIVAIIAAYRMYSASQDRGAPATVTSDRMVVQTGTGETIIRRDDIECLEAARNYVTVRTAEREFLVRSTLNKLAQKLAPGNFVRTHRSYLVNIDKIAEIRATDSGGHEIRLRSGTIVPLSRGYRDSFRSLFNE